MVKKLIMDKLLCPHYVNFTSEGLKPEIVLEALNKCKKFRNLSEPPYKIIGQGGFGRVFSFYLRRNKESNYVAVKVQLMNKEELDGFRSEVSNGKKMGKKGIGPKIFSAFYYNVEDRIKPTAGAERRRRRIFGRRRRGGHSSKFIGIIVMEQFQMDVWHAILYPPDKPWFRGRHLYDMVKNMLGAIDKMVSNKLFCSDIKPGNFVVNFYPPEKGPQGNRLPIADVALIDFTGQFCQRILPPHLLSLRRQAEHKLKNLQIKYESSPHLSVPPGLAEIHRKTAGSSEQYKQDLYGYIVKIALILRVAFLLKERFSKEAYKEILNAAYPFLQQVCTSDMVLENITETLVNDRGLYHIFMHNIPGRDGGANEDAKHAETKYRREIIYMKLKQLCDIKRRLDGVKSAKSKKGWKTKIKSALRPKGGRRTHKRKSSKKRRKTRKV